jgi:hypothetical protein
MSDAGGKKIKLWDGIIEYDEPVPDPKTEAVKAAIEARLVEFDHHKGALLTILRDVHNQSAKSEPFDEHKSWFRLTSLASTYYWKARVKQEVMPVADREARLRELEKALGKARAMVDEAMENDVGDALCSSWWEGTSEYAEAEGRFVDLLYIEREFKTVVTSLATLETAALRAASEAHEKRAGHSGPRRRTMLPDYIEPLAAVYRSSTGAMPGAGYGPFVRFICAFLAAIRANKSEEYVVELVQDARSRTRTHHSKWGPSAFDDSPFDISFDDSPVDD